MRFLPIFFSLTLLVNSSCKTNSYTCPAVLKLTADSCTPAPGDDLKLHAHKQSVYNRTGLSNLSIAEMNDLDKPEFAVLKKINHSGTSINRLIVII